MTSNAERPKAGTWTITISGILLLGNLAAAVFGCVMLVWAVQQMGYKGEQWGLLGIFIFSLVSIPIMLILLLPGTILLVILAAKRLPLWFRMFLIAAIAVGVITNLAAIACIPLSSKIREEEYKKDKPIYTSGLFDAVKRGDAATAESILKAEPEVIWGHTFKWSLLAIAVQNDDKTMVELLLKYGAEVKYGGGGLPSPLHVAAQRGNVTIAKILLDHGADINAEDSDIQQNTPLVYARTAGKTAMVQFLESKGASEVNLKEAAWRAAYYGKADDLRRILDKGFNPNETWASGTLLHTAADAGHVDIVKLLIDRGAKLDTMLGLGTPLHSAAYEGKAEIITYLISRGADPNAVESRNYTPLYWAAENGHLDAVRVLLENGAKPNLGESPLKEAKRQGHGEVVELLKQHGAKE